LDEIFEAMYGFDFSPDLWGRTIASFLEELEEILIRQAA
jgi:hypothetical protein